MTTNAREEAALAALAELLAIVIEPTAGADRAAVLAAKAVETAKPGTPIATLRDFIADRAVLAAADGVAGVPVPWAAGAEAAHKARIAACSAWSNVLNGPMDQMESRCKVAADAEAVLTAAIDALAATPSPAQPQPAQGVSDDWIDELLGEYDVALTKEQRTGVHATVRAALAAFGAVPEGYALLKNTTHAERDWHGDASHENGSYSNDCRVCLRQFIGHKRRHVCRACSEQLQADHRREGGDL